MFFFDKFCFFYTYYIFSISNEDTPSLHQKNKKQNKTKSKKTKQNKVKTKHKSKETPSQKNKIKNENKAKKQINKNTQKIPPALNLNPKGRHSRYTKVGWKVHTLTEIFELNYF